MIDIQKANQLVNWLCQENNIIIRERREKCSGTTHFYRDKSGKKILKIEIDIPIIKDIITFGVALHEIGHAINGIQKTAILDEFEAEMFAIKIGKKYGFNMNSYIKDARWHILTSILNSFNKRLKYTNIPVKVKRFVEKFVPDLQKYEGRMSFCLVDEDNKDIDIISYPKIKAIISSIPNKNIVRIKSDTVLLKKGNKNIVITGYEEILLELCKYCPKLLNEKNVKTYKL